MLAWSVMLDLMTLRREEKRLGRTHLVYKHKVPCPQPTSHTQLTGDTVVPATQLSNLSPELSRLQRTAGAPSPKRKVEAEFS